mmetsp:Transcript_417/g.389  ORF Transcript_417/g.389 Transcript_417/m.389 type:complete len:169 (+) Transcript_417:565-1071(+)
MDKEFSETGETLGEDDPAIPCGLIAYTYFQDEFVLKDSDGETIDITEEGIAWESDIKEERFKNIDLDKQWLDVESERFMVWMKLAGYNEFKKLWGIIKQDLPAGEYTITVTNKFDHEAYDSNKKIIVSTVNDLGGRNVLLSACYLVSAVIALSIVIVIRIKGKKSKSE